MSCPRGPAWLNGCLPEHWRIVPVKRAYEIQLGKMLQPNPGADNDELVPYLKAAHVQWDGIALSDLPAMWASRREVEQYVVREGDLLVCEGGEAGRAAVLRGLDDIAIIQNALHRVRPLEGADNRYLGYTLRYIRRTGWFEVLCNRATISHLTREKLAALQVPFPPEEEQAAIADFLDVRTAAIDDILAKKEHLRRAAVTHRAAHVRNRITHGLGAIGLKATGYDWLGEIPEHWVLTRLRHIADEITVGIVVTPAKYYVDEGVPCLRSLNIQPGRISADSMVYISPESNELHRKSMINAGDVVAVRTGNPGTAAVVTPEFDRGNAVDLIIIRRSSSYDARFLCYFMNSDVAQYQYASGSEGALQRHFNIETAKDLLVPLPPLSEQRAIADELDAFVRASDDLVGTLGRQIDALRDYRDAVIAAAVTGQVPVLEGIPA